MTFEPWGEPAQSAVQELGVLMNEATADFVKTWGHDGEARMILSAAAVIFAGAQMGFLMKHGMPADVRDVLTRALENFRIGMVAALTEKETRQ